MRKSIKNNLYTSAPLILALLLIVQEANSQNTISIPLQIPVRLTNLNVDVSRWQLSCEVTHVPERTVNEPRVSISQPIRDFFGAIYRIISRIFGLPLDQSTVEIPPGNDDMNIVTFTSERIGLNPSQPGQALQRSDNVMVMLDVLPVGAGEIRRTYQYHCWLSFLLREGTTEESPWLKVPEGDDAYEYPDVWFRTKQGTVLNTEITDTTSMNGKVTETITMTGEVPVTAGQLMHHHATTSPAELVKPHPDTFLSYIGTKCDPELLSRPHDKQLDYIHERVYNTCLGCHDTSNGMWVPNHCGTGTQIQKPDLFITTIEYDIEFNEEIVETKADQSAVDNHPASLSLTCHNCHSPGTWDLTLNWPEDATCNTCHGGNFFNQRTAQVLCSIPTSHPEKPDHVPVQTWELINLFSDYIIETEESGCNSLYDGNLNTEPAPGDNTYCIRLPQSCQ